MLQSVQYFAIQSCIADFYPFVHFFVQICVTLLEISKHMGPNNLKLLIVVVHKNKCPKMSLSKSSLLYTTASIGILLLNPVPP